MPCRRHTFPCPNRRAAISAHILLLAWFADYSIVVRDPSCFETVPGDECAIGAHFTAVRRIHASGVHPYLTAGVMWYPLWYMTPENAQPNGLMDILNTFVYDVIFICELRAGAREDPASLFFRDCIVQECRAYMMDGVEPGLQVGIVGPRLLDGLATFYGGLITRKTWYGGVILMPTLKKFV